MKYASIIDIPINENLCKEKYILLDFSWQIERKSLSLQPKVGYNILLWV